MSAASSRQAILDRMRGAAVAAPSAYASIERKYTRSGSLAPEERLRLMIDRLREYDAQVVECSPDDLPDAIAGQIRVSGKTIVVAPAELPAAWVAPGIEWIADRSLRASEIERTQGVITACSAGIADSGTIVLHHGEREGRRILTLLPDWHLCVLYASQVVETLPEYFARFPEPPRLATWISGPSATADIEMTRIKGVHGPRFMVVILVRDDLQRAE